MPVQNSLSRVRSLRSALPVGRPRKRPKGQGITIGFRAEEDLVREIDEIAAAFSPGVKLSRTQAIKALLREAINARKTRK